jgi:mannose-6-phosphate isomerase-like protein (cupin superfamily)
MDFTRRDLGFLLPVLAATRAAAQSPPNGLLPAKVYHSARIPYDGDQKKKARKFFHGATHGGFNLEAHETILGAGVQTHAPHRHEHEEIMIVFEGTLETEQDGKTEPAEAGSIIYFGSNMLHTVRNPGTTPCRYYVIELRGSEA